MLPARQGDALWIEYGSESQPHRVLIDAGTEASFEVLRERILKLPPDDRRFELLVVTHIDADHIGGAVPLLADSDLGVEFEDVWFNGLRHLETGALEPLGVLEGDRLSDLLAGGPWNEAWDKDAVVVPDDGPLPHRRLPGGLELVVLSPFREQLARLKPVWEETIAAHGLDDGTVTASPEVPPGLEVLGRPAPPTAADIDIDRLLKRPFEADTAIPNGTSIALLATFEGRSALLSSDAFSDVLLRGVERLLGERGEDLLSLEAFKLPHHGSRSNLHSGLAERIESPRHLISTNGARTHHPHPEALARVLRRDDNPRLIFNYRSEWNAAWSDPAVAERCGYRAEFPSPDGPPGIVVELTD